MEAMKMAREIKIFREQAAVKGRANEKLVGN